MTELTRFRLHVLRVGYLIIFAGLALTIWPLLIDPPLELPLMNGVVRSMLTAVSLLAALGLRYPVKMLPVMLFEVTWKTVWIVVFGLPQWLSGQMSAETGQTMFDCLLGVIFLVIIPWRYVFDTYFRAPSDSVRRIMARAEPSPAPHTAT